MHSRLLHRACRLVSAESWQTKPKSSRRNLHSTLLQNVLRKRYNYELEINKRQYEKLTQGTKLEIKYSPTKGRGLYAKEDIRLNEPLFSETPLVAAVSAENTENEHCWSCFKPLYPTKFFYSDESVQKYFNDLPKEEAESIKTSIMTRVGVRRFEKPIVHDRQKDVKFCCPTCSNDARAHYRHLLDSDQYPQLKLALKQMIDLPEKQRSMVEIMARIIARTVADPYYWEDKIAKLVSSSTNDIPYTSHYDRILDSIPFARQHFNQDKVLQLASLIALNSFSISASPLTVALRQDPDSKDLQMQFMKEPSNEVKLGAMYHLGSFCNHSCDPNVGLRAPSTSAEITWIAFKDIKAGEEVLASYVNSDLEYPIRHELLKRHYKFDCDCPKCKNQQ